MMPDFEKLYTVDDVASMMSLSSRTIRTYLKDGLLKGKKVGAQWRFTENDIRNLMNSGEAGEDMIREHRQAVIDFVDSQNVSSEQKVQTCTIVDIYTSKSEAKEKNDELCRLVNSYKESSPLSFKYNYIKSEEKARFTIFSEPSFLAFAIDILK